MNSIKLQEASVLQVPLKSYQKDFTFIVNGEEFHTNKFVADLLSSTISKQHLIDPTFNQFIINTNEKGDFQQILDLVNFEEIEIDDRTIPFLSSIFDKLKTEKIDIRIREKETTIDNVIDQLLKHEKNQQFYFSKFEEEIDFLSSNIYQIKEKDEEKFESFQLETLERIFNNSNLKLETEDQLFRIVNRLYQKDSTFSKLYEYVDFINVEQSTMKEFITIFDKNDMTQETWRNLLKRIFHEIKSNEKEFSTRIVKQKKEKNQSKGKEIKFNNNEFDGIFNYLRNNSNIDEEINITKSSDGGGDPLMDLVKYEIKNHGPCTKNSPNQWICFELKKHQIIPTYYSVKANGGSQNSYHPRTWVIEGSKDNSKWEKIDEQNNCSYLNGSYLSHSFPIKNENQHEFKYIRIKLTGPNWCSDNYLYISKFEIFGFLI